MKPNEEAFEVGQLAQRLAEGYYTYAAAIKIASNPRAEELIPVTQPGMTVPLEFINRKDGTQHVYDFRFFLQRVATKELRESLSRAWVVGSLLTVGDALASYKYFNHAPILELMRHLRNAVAHGNRFKIDKPHRLKKRPAHNRDASVKSDLGTVFEITPDLNGKPLFDYVDVGDALDILRSVGNYLARTVAEKKPSNG
jgi:hypothetical protein